VDVSGDLRYWLFCGIHTRTNTDQAGPQLKLSLVGPWLVTCPVTLTSVIALLSVLQAAKLPYCSLHATAYTQSFKSRYRLSFCGSHASPSPKWVCKLRKSILIVDDHEYVRRAVRSLFASTGLRVCGEAVDGVDAIQKAEELQPDLVVLDLSMPNMNGIEAARALKKIRPQLPILLLTAHFSALSSYNIHEQEWMRWWQRVGSRPQCWTAFAIC
jgi:CheY-like chemotaxis protein